MAGHSLTHDAPLSHARGAPLAATPAAGSGAHDVQVVANWSQVAHEASHGAQTAPGAAYSPGPQSSTHEPFCSRRMGPSVTLTFVALPPPGSGHAVHTSGAAGSHEAHPAAQMGAEHEQSPPSAQSAGVRQPSSQSHSPR